MIREWDDVAVIIDEVYDYPCKDKLFRPNKKYQEYPFSNIEIDEENQVYEMIRKGLYCLGLDKKNYGKKEWNPFKNIVNPGDYVLIKPNMVMDENHIRENGTDCLYTNPSIVAPIIDYIVIALKGNGKIIVGDAPMQECNWEELIKNSGYQALIEWYQKKGVNIELIDFRELHSQVKLGVHIQTEKKTSESIIVNLGQQSEFFLQSPEQNQNLRVTNYDKSLMLSHHNENKQEYCISKYILEADVIINVPKPKTHRKAGFTGTLKNFVGINARKEYLPHHTFGAQEDGGDEFDKRSFFKNLQSSFYDVKNEAVYSKRYLKAFFYKCMARICMMMLDKKQLKYLQGSWYGNHTISRTIIDLNKIVLYANKKGQLCDTVQRNIFSVADMIVSGEKEGPVAPSPKPLGVIIMGNNCVCIDEIICTLMGFDCKKIPTLQNARNSKSKYSLVKSGVYGIIVSNKSEYNGKTYMDFAESDTFSFVATEGWLNHIEL